MKKVDKIRSYLEREIWQLDLNKVRGIRYFLIKLIRSFIIAWRDFKKDNCQLKASALTLYTLLSIVPVIAMFFGIAKGFGFEKKLEVQLKSDLSYNQEIISYVFEFANSMLENTKGGLIAGFGIVLLFWSVMKVLGNIEAALNDIWEVKTARSWVRKFTDYMAIMLVAPILIIISSSSSIFISDSFQSATKSFELLEYIGPVVYFGLEILPVILTVLLFAMLYIILPNTKIKIQAAFFGALFGAAFFLLVEWIYLTFQVGVSRFNPIYGGFAALPLFLTWVQTNWLVVLLGAELSFAFQNQGKYEFEVESLEISHSYHFILSIAVVHSLIQKFKEGEEGPTASAVSVGLQMPAKLVRRILNDLVESQVILEVNIDNSEEVRYVPAIDIAKLDLNFVLRKLNDHGINEIPVEKNEYMVKIEHAVKVAQSQIASSDYNLLIKDL